MERTYCACVWCCRKVAPLFESISQPATPARTANFVKYTSPGQAQTHISKIAHRVLIPKGPLPLYKFPHFANQFVKTMDLQKTAQNICPWVICSGKSGLVKRMVEVPHGETETHATFSTLHRYVYNSYILMLQTMKLLCSCLLQTSPNVNRNNMRAADAS